jgi:hypothetical protein
MTPAEAVNEFVAGSNSSALPTVVVKVLFPPVSKTFPLGRSVAACSERGEVIELATSVNVFVAGSNSSALERTVVKLDPPAIRTSPFGRTVTEGSMRAAFMLDIGVNIPATGS